MTGPVANLPPIIASMAFMQPSALAPSIAAATPKVADCAIAAIVHALNETRRLVVQPEALVGRVWGHAFESPTDLSRANAISAIAEDADVVHRALRAFMELEAGRDPAGLLDKSAQLYLSASQPDQESQAPADVIGAEPAAPAAVARLSGQVSSVLLSAGVTGLQLFRKLGLTLGPRDNLVMSPLSVLTALMMAYRGASGKTKRAMEEALHLQGISFEVIDRTYQTLLDTLPQDGRSSPVLKIANGLFVHRNLEMDPAYRAALETYYAGKVDSLTAGDEARINRWIAGRTGGKITDLLQSGTIDPLVRLMLINAIYFNGVWKTQFDGSQTYQGTFYMARGSQMIQSYGGGGQFGTPVEATMMQMTANLRYFEGEGFRAVALPYAGGQFRMVILLPHAVTAQAGVLVNKLLETGPVLFKAAPQKVSLALPRFSAKWVLDLKTTLGGMGMSAAFSEDADFSGIGRAENGLYIGSVLHGATIDVDERGTEAAAATAVVMRTRSVDNSPQFHVDRPFFFAIVSEDAFVPLFMGVVNDPTNGQQGGPTRGVGARRG